MDHLKVLGVKLLLIFFSVLAMYELFDGTTLGVIVWMSVLTTIISYIVGDLLILRRSSNLFASLFDFGLAFITLWLLSNMYIGGGTAIAVASLLAAFFIACCEPFIHLYMIRKAKEPCIERRGVHRLQTEFSKEADVHDLHTTNRSSSRKF